MADFADHILVDGEPVDEAVRRCPHPAQLGGASGIGRPAQHRDPPRPGKDLSKQFEPFSGAFQADLNRHPGDVAARPGEAGGKAETDRIAGERDDQNRSRQLRDGADHDATKCRD